MNHPAHADSLTGYSQEPIYRLESLTKAYNGRMVVNIAELTIYAGEIFALVGPSGAGKSTLLRLLNFLEPPSTGKISFLGQDFQPGSEMPLALRRRVTTVFQRPALLNRNVQENVAYGLRLRSTSGTRLRSTVNALDIQKVLHAVGLKDLARQPARKLSGGEAQRVALARAILLNPAVLLLDEPTANLDPYNIRLIEDIIQHLNQENQTTLILVTHNIFQARRLAQRTALLLEGGLVEVADTETFFNHPKDPRTAAFVRGEMVY